MPEITMTAMIYDMHSQSMLLFKIHLRNSDKIILVILLSDVYDSADRQLAAMGFLLIYFLLYLN